MTEPEWHPCCKCCDVPGVPEQCYFNHTRDRHLEPCDECEKKP